MPLFGGFGFVKRALARSRIATAVAHVDSAMIVAGLRPEAPGALILVGAHSDHLHASDLRRFLAPFLLGRQRTDNRVWVNLELQSSSLEG